MTTNEVKEYLELRKKLLKELRKIKLTDQDLVDIVKFHKPEYGEKLDLEDIDEDDKEYQLILYIQELIGLAYKQKTSIQKNDPIKCNVGQFDGCANEYAWELVRDYELFDAEFVIMKYNECLRLYNLKPRGECLEEFLKLKEK